MNHNFRLLAAQRWIGANVYGTGRWAVVACTKKAVWLCPSEENARAASLGSCHQVTLCQANHGIFDLKPVPVPDIADDWEDRQRARREARNA